MATEEISVKLIQLNLWQGRIIRKATGFLKEQDAGFLCLQEVNSSETEPRAWDAFHSLEHIQNMLEHPYCFFTKNYSFYVAGVKVDFGNAILSRFPITAQHSVFTKGKYIADIGTEELLPNTRTIQSCHVDINGRNLCIVTHHGHREPVAKGSEESVLRMRKAAEFIRKNVTSPTIISGDMNVDPDTETAHVLDEFGVNLTREHNIQSTMTPHAHYQPVSPDHIIISEGITVKRFEVLEEIVSDHKALMLEFDL